MKYNTLDFRARLDRIMSTLNCCNRSEPDLQVDENLNNMISDSLTLEETRVNRRNAETTSTSLVEIEATTGARPPELAQVRKDMYDLPNEQALQSSPISRIPDDILSLILHAKLYPYSLTPSEDPSRLELVCRKWRNCLLSDTRFWTYFRWQRRWLHHDGEGFSRTFESANRQLKLSGTALLTIDIANFSSSDRNIPIAQLDLLSQMRPRVKNLVICQIISPSMILKHFKPLLETVEELTMIEESFDVDNLGTQLAGTSSSESPGSALRRANVDYLFFNYYPRLFRDVQELKIILFRKNTVPTELSLCNLPALASLELISSTLSTFSPPKVTGVNFPCLRELKLGICLDGAVLIQFLNELNASLLASFEWTPNDRWGAAMDEKLILNIVNIIATRWPTLASLALYTKHSAKPFDLAGVLRPFLDLQFFSIGSLRNGCASHLLEGIRSLAAPLRDGSWICPRLTGLTVDMPRCVAFDFSVLINVARARALSEDAAALRRLAYTFTDETVKDRLGLYVHEVVFEAR